MLCRIASPLSFVSHFSPFCLFAGNYEGGIKGGRGEGRKEKGEEEENEGQGTKRKKGKERR